MESTKKKGVTTLGIISSEESIMISESVKTAVQGKVFSTESTQEINTTIRSQNEVTIQSHISTTSKENEESTTSSISTSKQYISETLSIENLGNTVRQTIFENITVTGDQSESRNQKRMYQPSRLLIIIAIIIFTILSMLVLAITVIKCRKYREIQRNRRRRNRIFRQVGMIPMTSVINERYMGPEEG